MTAGDRVRELKAAGFDLSYADDGASNVRCSGCDPEIVDGEARHEDGCKNDNSLDISRSLKII